MSSWRAKLQYPGQSFSIYFLSKGGRCPTEELLAGLARGDIQSSRKATAYLQRLAQRGTPQNDEVCKKLPDDLWELKPQPYRLFFFIRGNGAYFTHGYKKETRRLQAGQLERARRIRNAFLANSGEELT